MPFCSLDEAWGMNPAPVKYPKSDVYTGDGKSIYNDCENTNTEPPLKKSWSRTNERLPQTSGPTNRYGGNYENNIGTYGYQQEGSGLKRQVDKPDNYNNNSNYNYKNDEVPITKYDKEYVYANDTARPYRGPVHVIEQRKQSNRQQRQREEEEQYDNINASDIDRIIYSEQNRKKWKNHKQAKEQDKEQDQHDSDMESVASSASYTHENRYDMPASNRPIDVNRRYRELESKFGSKRGGTDHTKMIRHLLTQNEQLKQTLDELKSKPAPQSSGFFSIWDLLIVILVGIIMICVLDYVYRIALSKASIPLPSMPTVNTL
jgi:hypothetical protein